MQEILCCLASASTAIAASASVAETTTAAEKKDDPQAAVVATFCEAAEKLADEEDVISAFHQLQKLHQEFRNTGPVAKELREDIWTRFKTASTAVNRRHQQHFEALKKQSANASAVTFGLAS